MNNNGVHGSGQDNQGNSSHADGITSANANTNKNVNIKLNVTYDGKLKDANIEKEYIFKETKHKHINSKENKSKLKILNFEALK